jgi:hypothetical protein
MTAKAAIPLPFYKPLAAARVVVDSVLLPDLPGYATPLTVPLSRLESVGALHLEAIGVFHRSRAITRSPDC